MVVDLPAPLGPSSPKHTPLCTSRSRPSTATMSPKRLTTLRSEIAPSPAAGVAPSLSATDMPDTLWRQASAPKSVSSPPGSVRRGALGAYIDAHACPGRVQAHINAPDVQARAGASRRSSIACAGANGQAFRRPLPRAGANELSDARKDPADRRPWWRRLLDGARALAARRLRALAHRSRPRARLLPADRVRRRRPLRRALLPPFLARLRGQPRLALPARPGHRQRRGRPRGAPARAGPHLCLRRKRREHARRLARAWA